jgi:hypothetical protein
VYRDAIRDVHDQKEKVMKSIRRNQTTTAIALAALFLAGTLNPITSQPAMAQQRGSNLANRDSASVRSIVGVWSVEVQSYVCGTNTPVGRPFSSVLTFNEGGTLTGATTNPAFALGQRGIDQGTWTYENESTYKAKDIAFLFFTSAPAPPSNPGFQAGSQILSETIALSENSDEFTSKATTEFFDVDGKSYRQGCATAAGKRLE